MYGKKERGDYMYLNLRYQMCKQGITPRMLANELHLSEKSVCNKLNSKTDFTITEANYISKRLKRSASYLFSEILTNE